MKRKRAVQYIVFAVIVAVALWLGWLARQNDTLRTLVVEFGYGGVLIVSVISGVNLFVPIPAVAFFPLFLESGLNPVAVIITMSLGMTIADSISFFLGKAGRRALDSPSQHGWFARLDRFRQRNYWWPIGILFLFVAFAPLPNELLVIPLALLGYPLIRLMAPLLIGNIVFNTVFGTGILAIFQTL